MDMKTIYDTTTEDRTDEAAVRELFHSLLDCWGKGDAEAYAALFTEDAYYIAFDGSVNKGRAENIASHKPLFEKWLKGSRLAGEIINLQFLCPDVALIHASGSTVLAGKTQPSPERESIQTLVAVKREGKWLFTAFHNTRVRPIGSGIGGVLAWVLADKLWQLLGSSK